MRCGLRRSEAQETFCAQHVAQSRDERRFRPEHHEIDGFVLAEGDHGLVIVDVERDQFGVIGDPGLPGAA